MKETVRKFRPLDDFKTKCSLEPNDRRNFLLVEDFFTDIHITIQHMAYGFWFRLKLALSLLFKGYDSVDISISENDASKLLEWLTIWEWNHHAVRDTFEKYYGDVGEGE